MEDEKFTVTCPHCYCTWKLHNDDIDIEVIIRGVLKTKGALAMNCPNCEWRQEL